MSVMPRESNDMCKTENLLFFIHAYLSMKVSEAAKYITALCRLQHNISPLSLSQEYFFNISILLQNQDYIIHSSNKMITTLGYEHVLYLKVLITYLFIV